VTTKTKTLFDTTAIESEGILRCGGDYNVVMNPNLDTTSPRRSKKHLTKFINTSEEEMGLIDVCRELHPLKRDYTHCSVPHSVHFLINTSETHRVTQCKIGVADISDHSLTIQLNNRKINTVRRLNVGILNNKANVEQIRKRNNKVHRRER